MTGFRRPLSKNIFTSQPTRILPLHLLLLVLLWLLVQNNTQCCVQAFSSTTRQSSQVSSIRQTSSSSTVNTANVLRHGRTRIPRLCHLTRMRAHYKKTNCCFEDESCGNRHIFRANDPANLSSPTSRRASSLTS